MRSTEKQKTLPVVGPYAERPLHEAIADLSRGALDPLQHDWLVLGVV